MKKEEIIINPIGYVSSNFVYRYETPRQGVLAGKEVSLIELIPHQNFEQAVYKLDGFDRIWVIYLFHLNDNWKPLVNPPRHTREKIGVFATRAPYRPNRIGMSCVKLEKIDGLKIFISESDILDGSPVLDIKPYLPYSDSFPDVATGWVKKNMDEKFDVSWDETAEEKMKWLKDVANINLKNFARLQLEFNPTDNSRKRITQAGETFILAYRTWRIIYNVSVVERHVLVRDIESAYSSKELKDAEDKYEDKELHKEFAGTFDKKRHL
jgi:tRNA (adenine37-N6)-methyltransferase